MYFEIFAQFFFLLENLKFNLDRQADILHKN